MAARIRVDFQYNGLMTLPESVERRVSQVVRKTCFDIQRSAQDRVPVDTSAAKNSIHVILIDWDGQGLALASVRASNPRAAVFTDREEVHHHLEGLVVVAVMYGINIEYGSFHPRGVSEYRDRDLKLGRGASRLSDQSMGTYTPARPFLGPSVDLHRDNFFKAIGDAVAYGAQYG